MQISTNDNWIKFDMILKYKQTWFQWCRGFTYIFFIIYNLNQLVKFLRGFSVADGSAMSSTLSNTGNSNNPWYIKGQDSLFK